MPPRFAVPLDGKVSRRESLCAHVEYLKFSLPPSQSSVWFLYSILLYTFIHMNGLHSSIPIWAALWYTLRLQFNLNFGNTTYTAANLFLVCSWWYVRYGWCCFTQIHSLPYTTDLSCLNFLFLTKSGSTSTISYPQQKTHDNMSSSHSFVCLQSILGYFYGHTNYLLCIYRRNYTLVRDRRQYAWHFQPWHN